MISFSVDTQGEADDLVGRLMETNRIADVNFISPMVQRKFSLYGTVTSDPSQVRVEVVTADAQAQPVLSEIATWRMFNGKETGGAANDAVVTPLSGGSADYISFVLKQTGAHAGKGGGEGGAAPLMIAQKSSSSNDSQGASLAQVGGLGGMNTMSSFISEFY